MVWFLVAQIFSTLISLIQIGRMTESDKDLEIMVLRYQLGIAERKLQQPVRANRAERMTLAVLIARLKKQTKQPASQFQQLIRLVQPETVFRWHRDLVRRKRSITEHVRSERCRAGLGGEIARVELPTGLDQGELSTSDGWQQQPQHRTECTC